MITRRRQEKFTAAQVVEACKDTGGIKALVAQKLGCSRSTVVNYARRYATVRKALESADEALTDLAEGKSGSLIKEGYWPAIKYRLETKGKKRGYATRHEVTGADGDAVEVRVSGIDFAKLRDGDSGDD